MISRRTGVGAPIPSGVGCPLHSAQGLSRNWGAGAATRRLVATAPGGDPGRSSFLWSAMRDSDHTNPSPASYAHGGLGSAGRGDCDLVVSRCAAPPWGKVGRAAGRGGGGGG